jgi:hypothetical protein
MTTSRPRPLVSWTASRAGDVNLREDELALAAFGGETFAGRLGLNGQLDQCVVNVDRNMAPFAGVEGERLVHPSRARRIRNLLG